MAKKENTRKEVAQSEGFALGTENYKYIAVGVVIVIIGFILMAGGGTKDPNIFSPAIFSFRRITLAPLVLMVGYGIVIYAIMKKPKNKPE